MPGRSSLYSMIASMVSVCYLHEFCKLLFMAVILLNLEKLEEVIFICGFHVLSYSSKSGNNDKKILLRPQVQSFAYILIFQIMGSY